MPAQKLAKKLPKRAATAKVSRADSWKRNQRNKEQRIKHYDKLRQDNLITGCTGKMRVTNNHHSPQCERGNHVPSVPYTNKVVRGH